MEISIDRGALTVLYATNAYSGTDSDLAADQAYDYTSSVDLATLGYSGIEVEFRYDSVGTTDNIILSVFESLDGTNWGTTPSYSITLSGASGADTPEVFDFPTKANYIRFGFKTSGLTDTFDVKLSYRLTK